MHCKVPVLIALAVIYAWDMFLHMLSRRSVRNPLPENVRDVYNAESFAKWKRYRAEKSRVHMLAATVSFALSFLLLLTDAYAAFARLFPEHPYPQLIAVLLLSALAELASLPFSWYDTMHIEEKYGFNRSGAATFWADQAKGFFIELGVLIAVAGLLMWVHQGLGDWMIVVFAAAMTLILLGFSFLYPVLSRLFNKFTPLEEGELRDRLTKLLEKHGYRVRAVQVMDASRRSTRTNAYFAGFGRMKTIVLYDTLLAAMTPDEICAVFAHEMGHGLHRDTLKRQLLSFAQMLLIGVLAWLTLRTPAVFADFGFSGVNYGFALILIMSVEYALLSPLLGLIANAVSRRAEYRADAQAAAEGYAGPLVSGLKKLARGNFADLSPDPLLVRLEYSHPTLSQRIEALTKVSPA